VLVEQLQRVGERLQRLAEVVVVAERLRKRLGRSWANNCRQMQAAPFDIEVGVVVLGVAHVEPSTEIKKIF
jgi:hypothetical protein